MNLAGGSFQQVSALIRFSSKAELRAFKRALMERYPSASWTRYLQMHSAWINLSSTSMITLHYWRGTTSVWLSGNAAKLWYHSDDFTQLLQQATAAIQPSTGAIKY